MNKSLLKRLMLGAAFVAVTAAAGATHNPNRVSPMWGNIDPVWGNIDPVWGNIDPVWGNIDPVWGNIDPVWGNIDPVWGNIDPVWKDIKPLWGNIDPVWGNIDPVWGNIDPVWGNIDPVWGNIDPVWGNIDPVWGNIDPVWGNIDPVWKAIGPFASTLTPFSTIANPHYGKESPFWGDTSKYWGRANPFWGNIDPVWGNIDPVWGNIDPVWGNIDPVWGNIDPVWGNIDPVSVSGIHPFWGNIDPVWGNIDPVWGNIDPVWNKVGPYWQATGPEWGAINTTWAALQASHTADYGAIQADLAKFMADAKAVWGAAVEAGTGKSFEDFANPIFEKYGIDPNNPASLAKVSGGARSAFFLAWYDGLMGYSGMPRVDWWMGAVNWTPLITQIQNPGTHTVIGVLDSRFYDVSTNVKRLEFVGGYDYFVNDHGAAVASLIASQHTAGKVMGIAPNSPVLLYNPFDYTGTASWEDVAAGINALYAHGASVINASMGLPGYVLTEEWAQILTSPQVNKANHPFVLVKAAGNDGVTQTTDINWIGSAPNNIILVGSVGLNGTISSFSNRPGNACILVGGICEEQNKLMYHFIVAPGENILVSNNAGGVMRASGTSFSTPLVTGAVALLQDRWPWLKRHPAETVDIIFESAKDLGAPGVDPVYGWGELDIEASQSPLDFNKLTVLTPTNSARVDYAKTMPAANLKSALLDPGQLALWNQQGAYLIAFESIGTTYRDFAIPLSSLLLGKKLADGNADKPFQTYLYKRLIDWSKTPQAAGFNSVARKVMTGDWNLSLTATETTPDEQRRSTAPMHYEFAARNSESGLGFVFGEGSGAHALMSIDGFSQRSDFDPETGGVNPVMGFASGGAYGRAELSFGKARFSFGFTQKTDDHMAIDPTYGYVRLSPFATTKAFASVIGVDYEVMDGFKLNASYTNLRESQGLLGSQGAGMFEMNGGTSTAATTLSASYAMPKGWTLLASATMARSASPQFAGSVLRFTKDGMTSTAYQLVAEKTGLFEKTDLIRLTLAQPLHIEAGAIEYRSLRVVDRDTGELGSFSQSWDVSGAREIRMEALYGTPVMEGTGELDGYALADFNPRTSKTGATELALGARLRFDF